jgi:hypothetical protein
VQVKWIGRGIVCLCPALAGYGLDIPLPAWLEPIDIVRDSGLLWSGLLEGLRDQGRTMDAEVVCMLGSIVHFPKLIQVPEFDQVILVR